MAGDETLSAAASVGGDRQGAQRHLVPGDRVGRYLVRRLLGEGGMGRVYLARDMALGRSVALKIVRTSEDRDPRQLIAEAQTTARFSHPHIVQLYDVGELGGSPYLALEYLEGESLRERMKRDRLSVDEVLRITRAIADALAHAHAAGVLHCDLKPSNIVLPVDGRLRVVDFGLASTIGRPGGGGTPDWMAPEQWMGAPLTNRTDIWALAVLVHELLAHEHPFGPAGHEERRARVVDPEVRPHPLGDNVPSALAELVIRSLSREPEARPSATDWLHVLDEIAAGHPSRSVGDAPYRGLAAFDESHAHLFFGREADVDAFLEELRAKPLLAVVGPSGAGKSSFVHAGVVARLRAREPWTMLSTRPGTDPFHSLAATLEGAGASARQIADTAEALRETPTLLALRLSTLADRGKLALVIDQLEELFTHGSSETTIARFLEMILRSCDDPRDPVRVIVTLRDDFIGRIADLRHVYVLRRLGMVELRRAITAPLERTGYRFEEPAIVDDMLGELGDAANLPLLQFACRVLWDLRDTEQRTLTCVAYRELGGVAGALARHADAFMDGLSTVDQATARTILLRLVAGNTARRTLERHAVLTELSSVAEAVLDRMLAARLVVQRRVEGEQTLLVELAHESLLTAWPRLGRWLEETGEQRRLLDELREAEAVWERRGRPVDATWSASEIANARGRSTQTGLVLPPRLEHFLATGELRHERMRRRKRTRLILGLAIATTITVGSLVLAHTFREQRIAAELANGNLGRSTLVLRPFDIVDGKIVPIAAADLPQLTWRLHSPAETNVHREGAPLPDSLVHAHTIARGSELQIALEAPGGSAFLEIAGRGRAGERCGSSWVRLQRLPGYAAREVTSRFEITFPTCGASASDVVVVPGGEAIYGGTGVPATQFPDYVEREHRVQVPAFVMDITEVSNARFAPFATMAAITGYPVPIYPSHEPYASSGAATSPVSAIDAYAAEAFCRFMGKRLPSDYEWTKAARGGVEINGKPNESPRRLYPWGERFERACVNAEGPEDGYEWAAPVGSLPCGKSPYGVLDLAGNVAEWISREGQVEHQNLRVVRGGALDSPVAREQVTTVFRNSREDRQFDLALGVRCVADLGE